jgi:hypothetical protein
VTANEIIDDLLMAFPLLGLSKVVWAIDIILAMDIPEFRLEMLDAQAFWHEVAPLASIPEGGVNRLTCAGREVFVYRRGYSDI